MTINKYIVDSVSEYKKPVKIINVLSKSSFTDACIEVLSKIENVVWSHNYQLKTDNCIMSWFYLKRPLIKNEISGHFLVYERNGIVQIITREDKPFIDSGINFLIKQIYPNVINAFVTSDEIELMLEYFEKENNTTLYHKNLVVKELLNDVGTEVKYKKGKVKIELRQFKQAFIKARLENLWIDKIEIFSEKNKFHFYIGRDGRLSIFEGNYEDYIPIYKIIINKYIEKYDFLSYRSREFLSEGEIRPIKIPFETNIFDEQKNRNKFIEMIDKYTYCNYSIEYVSNPHIHINIMDTLDFSVFSLKTYSANSLIISPQIRVTEAALLRFSKFLLDNFREITMENFIDG